ncbi:PREDICTED: DNA-directed RNA polymerase I subunit RPA43-like [Priapulus caudatus]|uniref:DNA-directed RNA polymerase I subunit RPA43-like n=1 Tax=Priapulus caudatus TaxID=37621 RepID=A0ABM1EGF5_PRICU|nr:PREDICTED: DNA-directed RNA polymerase I subunit RPA43-like [Priapulus caudatus]
MSLLTFKEACKLISDKYSCFKKCKQIRQFSLPPFYIGKWRTGVNAVLSNKLEYYSHRLGGVFVAYDNIQLQQSNGCMTDDQSHIHFTLSYDAICFQPQVGCLMKGIINKIGHNHIGCLVHSIFNASIVHMPDGAPDIQMNIGDEIMFEVVDVVTHHGGLIHIKGKLTKESSEEMERITQNSVTTTSLKNSLIEDDIIPFSFTKLIFKNGSATQEKTLDSEISKSEAGHMYSSNPHASPRKKRNHRENKPNDDSGLVEMNVIGNAGDFDERPHGGNRSLDTEPDTDKVDNNVSVAIGERSSRKKKKRKRDSDIDALHVSKHCNAEQSNKRDNFRNAAVNESAVSNVRRHKKHKKSRNNEIDVEDKNFKTESGVQITEGPHPHHGHGVIDNTTTCSANIVPNRKRKKHKKEKS